METKIKDIKSLRLCRFTPYNNMNVPTLHFLRKLFLLILFLKFYYIVCKILICITLYALLFFFSVPCSFFLLVQVSAHRHKLFIFSQSVPNLEIIKNKEKIIRKRNSRNNLCKRSTMKKKTTTIFLKRHFLWGSGFYFLKENYYYYYYFY